MESIVLDSTPTVPIKLPDSDLHLFVSPRYLGRSKGQPILGQKTAKYTHYITIGDASPQIKKLMEIKATDVTPSEPIDIYKEVLKAEAFLE